MKSKILFSVLLLLLVLAISFNYFSSQYFYAVRYQKATESINAIGGDSDLFPKVIIIDNTHATSDSIDNTFTLAMIADSPGVKCISANNCDVSDKTVNDFYRFTNLRYLYLRNCKKVSRNGLENLRHLKNPLLILDLSGCNISTSDIMELKKRLQQTNLIFDNGVRGDGDRERRGGGVAINAR